MAASFVLAIIFIRFIAEAIKAFRASDAYPKAKIKNRLFKLKRNMNPATMFSGSYIDSRVFYALKFRHVPNIALITFIDAAKVFKYLEDTLGSELTEFYQYTQYDCKNDKKSFICSVFVLKNGRMIELGSEYAVLLFNSSDFAWARNMEAAFSDFRMDDAKRFKPIGFTLPDMN